MINNGSLENNADSSRGYTFYVDRDNGIYENNGSIAANSGGFWFDDFASFTNSASGTVTGDYAISMYGISKASSTFDNAGLFDLSGGNLSLVDLATINNSGTMRNTGGDIAVSSFTNFNNSGAIEGGAAGSVSFTGGALNHQLGGTYTGGANLNFTGTTLNLASGFTSDFTNVSMTNTDVNGPGDYHNAMGTTLTLSGTDFAAVLVNDGLVQQTIPIAGSGVSNLNGGLVNNTGGVLRLDSSAVNSHSSSTVNVVGDVSNSGTIEIVSSGVTTSASRVGRSYLTQTGGTFTNHAGGVIESKRGSNQYFWGNWLSTDHLINNGSLENNADSSRGYTFYVDRDNGVYENNGSIAANSGGFWFDDFASFTNSASGTVTGDYTISMYGISKASSTFDNTGVFDLSGGNLVLADLATVNNSGTIRNTGGDISLSGFTDFSNSGAIESAATRSVTFSGGALNHQLGGTYTGGANLNFTGTTLNLASDFTSDFSNVNMTNADVNGMGDYVNPLGTTLSLLTTDFGAELINGGLVNQTIPIAGSGVSNLNGGLVNNTGGVLKLDSSAVNSHSSSTVNVVGDVSNSGTIEIVSSGVTTSASRVGRSYLTQTGGTFTNHAGGVIESKRGSNQYFWGNWLSTDHLINNGSLENNADSSRGYAFYVDRDNGVYENNGSIAANSGGFWFDDFASFTNSALGVVTGDFNYTLQGISSASATFDNAGLFDLTSGNLALLDLATINNSGTLKNTGGDISFSGFTDFNNSGAIESAATRSVSFTGGTLNHLAGGTYSGETLNFTNTTINLDSDIAPEFDNVNMTNAVVNGIGTYTSGTGKTLNISQVEFAAGLVNHGLLKQATPSVQRTSQFNQGLSNHVGATLLLESTAINTHASSTADVVGDIDNSGTIELVSSGVTGSASRVGRSYLNHSGGVLTNNAGGLIESKQGEEAFFWGNFVRTDHLINHGTIRNSAVGYQFYFDRPNAVYENDGSIEADAGAIYFGDAASFTNLTGGILAATGGNIQIDQGTFLNQGTILGDHSVLLTGGASLVNEGMISPGESPGALSIVGDTMFADSSILLIELGGIDQGITYDFLDVTGTASLDGVLDLDLWGGFTPDASDTFTIMSAGTLSGNFDNAISSVTFESGTFDISYSGGSVVLSNFMAVPEPGSFAMLFAMVGIYGLRRQRRNFVAN